MASALNDREATLTYLERAIAEGESIPPGAHVEPVLRTWKDDTAIEATGELDAALAILDEARKSMQLVALRALGRHKEARTAAEAQGERIPPNSKLPPDLAVWADDKEIQKLLAGMRTK